MQFKKVLTEPETYVLVFKTGDEVAAGLKRFAMEHSLSGASFKAVGAFSAVKLAWYNPHSRQYDTSVDLAEQVELLSLIGDVATDKDTPSVHAHVVVGLRDGSTRGGHLLKAVVHPTCEVFLEVTPVPLSKQLDPESGLALIKL